MELICSIKSKPQAPMHSDECASNEELIWCSTKHALTDIEEHRLQVHLACCEGCRRYADACLSTIPQLRREIDREEPSSAFAKKLSQGCATALDNRYIRTRWGTRIRTYVFGAGVTGLAASLLVFADTVHRTPAATEFPLAPLTALWQIPNIAAFKESRACAPVLCGSTVYTIERSGPSGRIVAVNVQKGTVAWRSAQETVGYLSADSLRVFGVAMSNSVPQLQAFSARTGTLLWQFTRDNETAFDPTQSSCIGNSVYWSAGNTLFARDAARGSGKWQKQFGAHMAISAVRICKETIIVATGESVVCMNRDGAVQWTHAFAEPMITSVSPQLTIDDKNVFVAHRSVFGNSLLLCMDGQTGTELWRKDNIEVRSMLASDGRVFVRSRDLCAYSQKTGELQWSKVFDGCAPLTCADHVLYLSEAAEKGVIVSLDVQTGNVIRMFRTVGSCTGVIVAGDKDVVHSVNGTLYAFAHVKS